MYSTTEKAAVIEKLSIYFFSAGACLVLLLFFFPQNWSLKNTTKLIGLLDSDLPFLPTGMGRRQHVCHAII